MHIWPPIKSKTKQIFLDVYMRAKFWNFCTSHFSRQLFHLLFEFGLLVFSFWSLKRFEPRVVLKLYTPSNSFEELSADVRLVVAERPSIIILRLSIIIELDLLTNTLLHFIYSPDCIWLRFFERKVGLEVIWWKRCLELLGFCNLAA